jgi:hypothetical protein
MQTESVFLLPMQGRVSFMVPNGMVVSFPIIVDKLVIFYINPVMEGSG